MKTPTSSYKDKISKLIDNFPLPIDKHIVIAGRPPTSANSEFLTNKEQGDWAERLVVKAPVIGKIDMPDHFSAMKELDRGRLLFYVKFDGGQGYLDIDAFRKVVDP